MYKALAVAKRLRSRDAGYLDPVDPTTVRGLLPSAARPDRLAASVLQEVGQLLVHLVRIRVQPDGDARIVDSEDDQAAFAVREGANRLADGGQVASELPFELGGPILARFYALQYVRPFHRCASESVFPSAEPERLFPAVHRADDGVAHLRVLDGAGADHPAPVRRRVQLDHHVGVAVHDEVRVVGRKDDLAPSAQLLQGRDDRFRQEAVVQLVLGLVDDQRAVVLGFQQQRQQDADPLPPPKDRSAGGMSRRPSAVRGHSGQGNAAPPVRAAWTG